MIYLSGPMTGIPDYNFPAFNAAADKLRDQGYSVANPTAGVFIVEGEKCADALQAILKGAVAIAWPGGAQAIARHAEENEK